MALGVLAGCGGDGTTEARTPLPQVISDEAPAGERIDVRSSRFFPFAPGNRWSYAKVIDGTTVDTVLRQVVIAPEVGTFRITEADNHTSLDSNHRVSADGLVLIAPKGAPLPPSAAAIVGEILEYAEPFYAVGATRRAIRQGGLGNDYDGDTFNDRFRLEYTQDFVGFETLTLPDGSQVAAAHFRNVTTLMLQPSRIDWSPVGTIGIEDTWWGPGVGLLRADRMLTDHRNQALEGPYRLEIVSAQVDGRTVLGPVGDGTTIEIALPNRALVFDASRSRYYASVPGSVVRYGNRIAAIDAADGAITYSPPIGPEPGALALAPDASALYVGLNGSGDVLKLRLPDFVELQRTRLPTSPDHGQLIAENIAVSPIEPDVVAVSLLRSNASAGHGGVALLRAGALQSRLTAAYGGANLVVFAADGQSLFGFNKMSTESELRRFAVLPDGLSETAVVRTPDADFNIRSIDLGPAGLVFGSMVYHPDDLSLVGSAHLRGGCRAADAKLVCVHDAPFTGRTGRLAVVDATTFVIEATPAFEVPTRLLEIEQIVVGPAGQVALRRNGTYMPGWPDTITLLRSAALP